MELHQNPKLPILYRTAQVTTEQIDRENRTVSLSFSSETPVDRAFGEEILDHGLDSVRLGRLTSSGPVLVDHNPSDVVGVVESVEISGDRVGRATVRFGKSARADEVFRDVVDGIRSNVSVGYQIFKAHEESSRRFRVVDWEPYELSIVSVPADVSVGVGRANDSELHPITLTRSETLMTQEQTPAVQPEPAPTVDVQAIEERAANQARKAETHRIRELNAMGAKLPGAQEMAQRFIEDGKSVDEFRAAYLNEMPETRAIEVPDPSIGLSNGERQNYSFMRAIRALADPNDRKAQQAAAFEFECSEAAGGAGFRIPHDVLTHKRDLTEGGSGTGAEFIGEDLRGDSFIDMLRNNLALDRAGISYMMGLEGDVAIPKQTGAATAYWLANDTTAITDSTQGTGQVTMTPKNVGALSEYSRQFMLQSTVDAEAFVRNDLARVIGLEIDRVGLYGTGSSGQPTGIANTSGIGSVTLAAAAATWAEIVSLESTVATANALGGSPAYLTSFSQRGTAKTTTKDSGSGQFIWTGNEVNGYRAIASTQVAGNDWFYGDFSSLMMGMWGGLDILVDVYSQSAARITRVVAIQTLDFAVRHPGSFVLADTA